MSNHCPLLLESKKTNWGPKSFKSIDAWFTYSEYSRIVQQEWLLLGEISIAEKIKLLKAPFRRWNKQSFGHIKDSIKKFR